MNVLTPEFQGNLVKVVVQDHAFLKKHRNLLDGSLFKDKLENEVVKHTLKYFDKYSSVPPRNILLDYMLKESGYDIEDTNGQIGYLYEKITDIDYIEDSIIEFVRKNRLKDALVDSIKLLDKGKYSEILNSVRKVVDDFEQEDYIGDVFWSDTKSILEYLDNKEDFIPTGIHGVDDVLSGGAHRGTLNVIITPPNKGKSTALVNIGKYAALNGYNVVHYTLELSSMLIKRRYMMSMTRMSKKEMKSKKHTAYEKILKLAENISQESIIIKRYPSTTATIEHIRSHIKAVRNRFGFIPDLIIVDYADLLKPMQHYDQKRFELQEIYKALRDISIEFNSALWTATQTNRQGDKEELVTIQDLAEDFQKAAIADVIISLNQTLEEKRSHPQTARLFFAKNRDDESLITKEIKTDWVRAFIGNLD